MALADILTDLRVWLKVYGRKYNDAIKVKISDLFLYYLSATTPPYRNQCAVMSPHLHVSDKPCGKTDRVTRA